MSVPRADLLSKLPCPEISVQKLGSVWTNGENALLPQEEGNQSPFKQNFNSGGISVEFDRICNLLKHLYEQKKWPIHCRKEKAKSTAMEEVKSCNLFFSEIKT